MIHQILMYPPMEGLLPIPHCFQFPKDSPAKTYGVIVPEDLELSEGDGVYLTSKPIGSPDLLIKQIVERRPAKGDWSKQKVHKNPHYVRFIAQ